MTDFFNLSYIFTAVLKFSSPMLKVIKELTWLRAAPGTVFYLPECLIMTDFISHKIQPVQAHTGPNL